MNFNMTNLCKERNSYVKGCTTISDFNRLTCPSQSSPSRIGFFYNPPGDCQIYHIICESNDKDNDNNNNLVSDHAFNYKPQNEDFNYHITCHLISHSLIVQYLNKSIHGIELRQNDEP